MHSRVRATVSEAALRIQSSEQKKTCKERPTCAYAIPLPRCGAETWPRPPTLRLPAPSLLRDLALFWVMAEGFHGSAPCRGPRAKRRGYLDGQPLAERCGPASASSPPRPDGDSWAVIAASASAGLPTAAPSQLVPKWYRPLSVALLAPGLLFPPATGKCNRSVGRGDITVLRRISGCGAR